MEKDRFQFHRNLILITIMIHKCLALLYFVSFKFNKVLTSSCETNCNGNETVEYFQLIYVENFTEEKPKCNC